MDRPRTSPRGEDCLPWAVQVQDRDWAAQYLSRRREKERRVEKSSTRGDARSTFQNTVSWPPISKSDGKTECRTRACRDDVSCLRFEPTKIATAKVATTPVKRHSARRLAFRDVSTTRSDVRFDVRVSRAG